jgi:hypothetical protein
VISPALVQPTTRNAASTVAGLAQRLQVVFGGAEEQHEAQVRMQQLPRQVRRPAGIGGLGHGTDYAFTVVHRCSL